MAKIGRSVRVGIVGTSWWADLVHLPSLTSHSEADVVAIAGRDHERAVAIAQKYAIPQVYTDYRAMLEQARLDALVISAPDDLHYRITLDALDLGLHVLCEKPLAMNAAQARAMFEKAEAKRVKHMTFFTWRWTPQFRYMKQLVESGYIGQPYHAHFIQLGGYALTSRYAWRFDARRANGALGDLGSHMIDLARWLVGDVARVSAQLATHVRRADTPEPANDAAMLLLQFAGGVQGLIHVSAVSHVGEGGHQQRTLLHGAQGTLEAEPSAASGVLRGARQGDVRMFPLAVPDVLWGDSDRASQYDIFVRQSAGARQFVDAILTDGPLAPSFHDGWKAQVVIDAALQAHRSGTWVDIDS